MTVEECRAQRILNSRLIEAVRSDSPDRVRQLLAEGADPSAIYIRTRQILHLGAVKDACDSALIIAARNATANSHEIMQILVAAGADIGYISNWGETAAGILARQRDRLREYGIDGVLIEVLLAMLRPAVVASEG
jgi:hypothetical protein